MILPWRSLMSEADAKGRDKRICQNCQSVMVHVSTLEERQ